MAKCKDMGCFDGRMGIDIKENMNVAKRKAMANSTGGTGEYTMDSGTMG